MLALSLSAFAAEPRVLGAADIPKASTGTVKFVEYFLKTPTADLPAERVPEFIAVDRGGLPKKLQDRFEAKRMELLALKKNVDGKRKPPLRLLGRGNTVPGSCEAPKEMATVNLLLQVGFGEITENEEKRLMQDTDCTECELRTEFTLELVITPAKGRKAMKELHFLLHQDDPINVLIAGYRSGVKTTGTSFFGVGGTPKCR